MNKAYIVEQVDNVSYRVRIPEYHKLRGTLGCTKDENLPIAHVCVNPGIFPNFNKGDIVWVDYENDLKGNPVIVGSLLIKDSINTGTAIFCDLIQADGDVSLPQTTSIDTLKWKNFAYLLNIGGIIDSVNSKVTAMVEINYSNSTSDYKLSWTPLKGQFYIKVSDDEWELFDVKILDSSGELVGYSTVEEDGLTVKDVPAMGRITYYH